MSRARPRSARLAVEPLEDRSLPTGGLSATLVADVLPGGASSEPRFLAARGDAVFFSAADGTHGREVWVSDPAGTRLVKDIRPGTEGTFLPYADPQFTVVNGTVYFVADDGISGAELWRTDGTPAGTALVRDINPGMVGSSPTWLTTAGAALYFTADNGQAGRELWKSDGTAAGTVLVRDIRPGSAGAFEPSVDPAFAVMNGVLYFAADDGTTGRELWKTTGTAAGTLLVKDIATAGGSGPRELTAANSTLFFSADDGRYGTELWMSNGTAAGTVLVRDIFTGSYQYDDGFRSKPRRVPNSSFPRELTAVNGRLYFAATNGENGTELWRSDGTAAGTVLVRDIVPGPVSSHLTELTAANGTLFFAAGTIVEGGAWTVGADVELWRSDGTATGTQRVKDIAAGEESSHPTELTNVNGLLYFAAGGAGTGTELWQSDGAAAGTTLVRDIYPGVGGSDPGDLVNVGGKLYFAATDPQHGRELWDPPPVPGPVTQVSGPSPFAGFAGDPFPGDHFAPDSETVPLITTDPGNPNHIVTAWTQDEWAGVGASRGLVAGVSFDGGTTWRSVVVPGLTFASGGTEYHRTTDPRIAIGPDGSVYTVVVAGTPGRPFVRPDAILLSKSRDGGLTWDAPVVLTSNDDPGHFNHHAFVTPDPVDPDRVYVVWTNETGGKLRTVFSHSTDGGRTFTPFRVINDRPADYFEGIDQLFVHPDGTLVDVFTEFDGRQSLLSAIRSTDGGQTWSKPDRGPAVKPAQLGDPETGQGIWSLTLHGRSAEFAMDRRTGALYAVWEDARFGGGSQNDVAFAVSVDAGRHWSQPIRINQTPGGIALADRQAFLPSVAVATDGTVGVGYYDFRNNDPAPGLPTDYWFVHAHPADGLTNPAAWGDELRLTQASFDLERVPTRAGAMFLGMWGSTGASGNDFLPVWAMPHRDDPTSIFLRRVNSAGSPPPATVVRGGGNASEFTSEPYRGSAPAVFEVHADGSTHAGPAAVAGVQVNHGSARRSMVNSRTVASPCLVSFDAGAFERGSVAGGTYTLTIRADRIRDGCGQNEDGNGGGAVGGDRAEGFSHLFGDTDVSGQNRDIDRSAFGAVRADAGYLWYFDFDGDGDVDGHDNGEFNRRFGQY